ncbi:unknown [Prevotella sp. CAG:1124]|nr:unknown [Prevotella sp. CAG:1124]
MTKKFSNDIYQESSTYAIFFNLLFTPSMIAILFNISLSDILINAAN